MTQPTGATGSDWTAARDQGVHLLEARELPAAIKLLADAAPDDPSGETRALLGLAYFLSERYDEAALHYAAALKLDGDQPEWRRMLAVLRGQRRRRAQRVRAGR